jgi:hypothetical protein
MEKKIKVMILVNTLQNVASYVYGNHIGFFVWTTKNRPDIEIIFYTPQRMTIDMARTMAAKQALVDECDYLMFLDDDVLVPPDALDKLIKADKDIVAGLVIIRGYPFNVMAFKFFEDKDHNRNLTYFNELEKDVELQECDAVGFSCCLIKTDVYKEMEPPYFVTGPYNTEDVYFCLKAQDMRDDNGIKPSIFLHTGVQCGHMMPPEAVEWAVRDKMKSYYKEQADMMAAKIPVRDATYLNRSLNALGFKGSPQMEFELKP